MPKTGNATITNLEESEDLWLFSVGYSDTGITLGLPIPYVRHGMAVDEEDFKCMFALTDDLDEAPYFVITAIKGTASNMKGTPEILKDAPLFYYVPLLYQIVGEFDFSKMDSGYLDDFGITIPAVRITLKDDDVFGQHTIGVRDDWWMVLSLFPGTNNTIIERLAEYEEVIFRYMLTPYDYLPTVQTIELPESSLVLALPESMHATVDRYDEYTDREMVVYLISSSNTNVQVIFLTLVTVRKEVYQGRFLQELRMQELEEEVSEFLFGLGEVESEWLQVQSDYPLLRIREIGMETEEHKNIDIYHLIVIKEGWLLDAQVMDLEVRPIEEMLSMQTGFMMSMLVGDGETATMDSETVFFDTLNGTITLDVPLGYTVEQTMPAEGTNRCLLIDLRVFGKAYDFSFDIVNKADAGDTIDTYMESLQEMVSIMEEQTGESITQKRVEEGLLGEPTLVLTTESGLIYMTYSIKDGCMVTAGIQSKGPEITQEGIDRISDMIHFTEFGKSN